MRYWKRVKDGVTTTVENYSHDLEVEGAVEIDKAEYEDFINSLPKPVLQPIRNLAAELDELKAITADHEARLKKDVRGHIR